MGKPEKHERTLVLVKPDGVQRGLIGEIVGRYEKKGLKLVGLKMMQLNEDDVLKHYGKYADKPFFKVIKDFMTSSPIVGMVWEGLEAVKSARLVSGEKRMGYESEAGSIRGDYALSGGNNLVHSSDSKESAEEEISKFFNMNELFEYGKSDYLHVYSPEDL